MNSEPDQHVDSPRRLRRRTPNPQLTFTDVAPRDAATQLGFPNVEALWAFLRRHEGGGGRVDLGGGVHAYRRGARAWVIRIPRKLVAPDNRVPIDGSR